MKSRPENLSGQGFERSNNKDLVRVIPYDFSILRFKYELERRKQALDLAPQIIDGAEIHRELAGTQFEIYPVNVSDRYSSEPPRFLTGVKFTGQPLVTWASHFQEIVIESEDAEEALVWLRLEAMIQAGKEQPAEELAQRASEEQALDEVIQAIRAGNQNATKPAAEAPRKTKRPLTRPATVN